MSTAPAAAHAMLGRTFRGVPLDLAPLEDLVAHFEQRKLRASHRHAAEGDRKRWHFAIVGLQTVDEPFPISERATLRPVLEPPGEVELARALSEKSKLSAVARYSGYINYELSVDANGTSGENGAFTLAWWVLSAIRIRTLADFLVPLASDQSWSTISALDDGACHVRILEDTPRARRFGTVVAVSRNDLDWVEQHILSLAGLLETPKFRLAVDCLTTHPHEASLRMTTASLWSGVEALVGVSSELRFRVSALVASYIEPRGASRVSLYKRLKALYDFRSKAVHGAALSDARLNAHIADVRAILSLLVCRMVEAKAVPSDDEWESALLE